MTRTRPTHFQATPRRGRDGAQLRRELADSLRETESVILANDDLDYGGMFVQHPLLGRYDVPGLLRFMSAHEQRHQSQLVALVADSRFPAST